LFKAVEELGGIAHKSIVKGLDYLVIGAQASPAWVYSTYGRKIESVMQKKKNDESCGTQIVNEYDLVCAIKKTGGESILPDPNQPLF